MKRRIANVLIFAWVIIITNVGDIIAQCAMCKASVETNISEDGIGLAAKLNTGILYLFVTPYLLAMIIGFFWYIKSRAHKRAQDEAEFRKRRIVNL